MRTTYLLSNVQGGGGSKDHINHVHQGILLVDELENTCLPKSNNGILHLSTTQSCVRVLRILLKNAPRSWAATPNGNPLRKWTRYHGYPPLVSPVIHSPRLSSLFGFTASTRWRRTSCVRICCRLCAESFASSSCASSGKRPRIAATMRVSNAKLPECVRMSYWEEQIINLRSIFSVVLWVGFFNPFFFASHFEFSLWSHTTRQPVAFDTILDMYPYCSKRLQAILKGTVTAYYGNAYRCY